MDLNAHLLAITERLLRIHVRLCGSTLDEVQDLTAMTPDAPLTARLSYICDDQAMLCAKLDLILDQMEQAI